MMTSDIVGLKRSQINEASEALARAFNNDPMFRYFSAKGDRARANTLRWFCKLVLRYCESYRECFSTLDDETRSNERQLIPIH